jgi:FMN phosphatase YigB (HAD superfamily)
MKLAAAIFDIYGTLIEVGPAPADAAERWVALCEEVLGVKDPPTIEIVSERSRALVAADHAAARAIGISFPEVNWELVMVRVLPGLGRLDANARADFVLTHVRLLRTVNLSPGAGAVLQRCHDSGVALGIASNAQPYSIAELDRVLEGSGAKRAWFDPELCIWSFESGFSKPDPHVFRLLAARLGLRGIAPGEALMVGDRRDNDIEPARAQGFRTWWLTTDGSGEDAGNWERLLRALEGWI